MSTRIVNFADGFTSASAPSFVGVPPYVDGETKSANFTAEFGKTYFTTNAINIQLPAPIATEVIVVKIKDTSDITLVRAGAENIENVAANFVVSSDRGAVEIRNDGTNYWLV